MATIGSVPLRVGRHRRESYYALLASADAIVVTEDLVNMVTEAAGTGKPVYVQRLKGKSRRLGQFHELMGSVAQPAPSPARSIVVLRAYQRHRNGGKRHPPRPWP